jgi:hypothetical protein
VSDAEIFTRLYYYGTVQMGLSDERFWTMPFGMFMDLWAGHKQWFGLEKAAREMTIDNVVPL